MDDDKGYDKTAYNREYNKANYSRISVYFSKSEKTELSDYCAARGETVSGFLRRIALEKMGGA